MGLLALHPYARPTKFLARSLFIDTEGDIAHVIDRILEIHDQHVRAFVRTWSTLAGALEYLERTRGTPGSWRTSLMFALTDVVRGRDAACSYLRDQVGTPAVKFTVDQIAWLQARSCLTG